MTLAPRSLSPPVFSSSVCLTVPSATVTHKNTQSLRTHFGTYATSVASKACATVFKLRSAITDETTEKITAVLEQNNSADVVLEKSKEDYFGKNIEVCHSVSTNEG